MAPRAVVIERSELRWSAGSPEPVLLASEDRTLLAFDHRDGDVAVVEFIGCSALRFGFPNDEVQHGHPLWPAGLTFYRAHRVDESPWLVELRAVEAVHPSAPRLAFPQSVHYVLTFHDSTLEVIATEIVLVERCTDPGEALALMAGAVADGSLGRRADLGEDGAPRRRPQPG